MPKTTTETKLSVYMPLALRRWLRKKAQAQSINSSAYVRQMLLRQMAREQKQEEKAHESA